MMRGLLTLHGITNGGDDERRGYSQPLVNALTRWGRPLLDDATWTPDVTEILYASLLQRCARASGLSGRLPGVPAALEDYALDVVVYAGRGCRELVMTRVSAQIHSAGPGRVLLAHSLGSVVAIDLLMDWLRSGAISSAKPRHQWPIAGLVTIGSPLGIDVPFASGAGFLDRAAAAQGVPGAPPDFRWINIADPQDVVVTGARLGKTPDLSDTDYAHGYPGYACLGCEQWPDIDCGGYLDSHGGYWHHPTTAQACLTLMGMA